MIGTSFHRSSNLGVSALLVIGSAAAQSSWQPVPGRAIAALPRALQGQSMSGGDYLSCSRGEYWLGINTMTAVSGTDGAPRAPGRLTVDGTAFPTMAYGGPDENRVMVPVPALAAFKAGNQLTVQFQSGSGMFSAAFSLRGSSSAVDHVITLCNRGVPGAIPW